MVGNWYTTCRTCNGGGIQLVEHVMVGNGYTTCRTCNGG